MAHTQPSWIGYGIASFDTPNEDLLTPSLIHDTVTPLSMMVKRKVDREHSTDSSSKRSETPTLAINRTKKASKPTHCRSSIDDKLGSGDNTESPPTARSSRTAFDDEEGNVFHSASFNFAHPHRDVNPSVVTPMNAFSGLTYPSAIQAAAALAQNHPSRGPLDHLLSPYHSSNKYCIPAIPAMTSRKYFGMAHPNLDEWNSSQHLMPNSSPGQMIHHVPSPLGQMADHSSSRSLTTPSMRKRSGQNMMPSQPQRWYNQSQECQDRLLLQNQRTTFQKAPEVDNQSRDWFVHGHWSFTPWECLLVCALKTLCRPLRSEVGVNDEIITEIIQHQRGWRDTNGVDCKGLYVALTGSTSNVRGQIQSILRMNRPKWEWIAWSAYSGWVITMKDLCARMIIEGQMDMATGQIPGSGFDGNVHDHLHNVHPAGETPRTPMGGTISGDELKGIEGRGTFYQHETLHWTSKNPDALPTLTLNVGGSRHGVDGVSIPQASMEADADADLDVETFGFD